MVLPRPGKVERDALDELPTSIDRRMDRFRDLVRDQHDLILQL